MRKDYTVMVNTDEVGTILRANLLNNRASVCTRIDLDRVPMFIYERVALLRLTDINKTSTGDLIGRKLQDNQFVVYLDVDEHKRIHKFVLTGVNK